MSDQLSESQWSELRICVHCRRRCDVVGDAVFDTGRCCLCGAEDVLTDVPKKIRQAVLDAGLNVEIWGSKEQPKQCRACYLVMHSADPFLADTASEPGWCSHCGSGGVVLVAPSKQTPPEKKAESGSSSRTLCMYCRAKSSDRRPDGPTVPRGLCSVCGRIATETLLYTVGGSPPSSVPAVKTTSMDDEDLRSVFSAAHQASGLADRVLLRLRDLAKAYQVTQGQEPTPLRYSLTDLADAKSQLDYILSKKPKI